MYQSHFHLQDRPFSTAANPEHYYPANSVEQARENIALNVERHASVTMVTGPVGCGKTLLCQLIANQYSGDRPVCLVAGENLDRPEELLQAILYGLGLPIHGQDEAELRLVLSNHVTSPACLRGILLIIDDAEKLSPELLAEVRSITNMVREGRPCVCVLLVGSPRLEENLFHPALESLNQRVVGRLYLDNFQKQETADYVRARLAACGGDSQSLFTEDALSTVHRATNGVPRLVNQICDHTLLLGSVNKVDRLDAQIIEEAWADLQQLPIPDVEMSEVQFGSDTSVESEAVIEFGVLEDDQETNELVELEQSIADLGFEASRATQPLMTREVEFEPEHDIKAFLANPPYLDAPGGTKGDEEETGEGNVFEFDAEEAHDEVDAIEVDSNLSIEFETDGDEQIEDAVAMNGVFETPLENASPEATFSFSVQEVDEEENSSLTQFTSEMQVDEADFEILDDQDDASEPPAIQFSYELSELAESNFTDEVQVEEEPGHEVAFEVEDSIDPSANESAEIESPEIDPQFEDSETLEADEPSPTWETESVDNEASLKIFTDDAGEGASDESDGSFDSVTQNFGSKELAQDVSAEDKTDHEYFESESWEQTVDAPPSVAPMEPEPTLDQVTNPFAGRFADDDVVVKSFVSPSTLLRDDYDPVTTAYSQQLAVQLAAAHPGLRMHPAQDVIEVEDVTVENFQPLSAYIGMEVLEESLEDSVDPGVEQAAELETDWSAKDDPVMPESSDLSLADPSSHEERAIAATEDMAVATEAAEAMSSDLEDRPASDVNEEPEATNEEHFDLETNADESAEMEQDSSEYQLPVSPAISDDEEPVASFNDSDVSAPSITEPWQSTYESEGSATTSAETEPTHGPETNVEETLEQKQAGEAADVAEVDAVTEPEPVSIASFSHEDDYGSEANAEAEVASPGWESEDSLELQAHDLSGHDLSGHDLSGHDLSGHDLSGHDLSGDEQDEQDEQTDLSDTPVIASIGIQPAADERTRVRRFRRLFSSIRGKRS